MTNVRVFRRVWYLFLPMHYIAPLPIIIGVIGGIAGLLWLIATGSETDGGPEPVLFFIFGIWYIVLRVSKALFSDPMSVLPAFGILGLAPMNGTARLFSRESFLPGQPLVTRLVGLL